MKGRSSSKNAPQKFGCFTVNQRVAAAKAAKRIRQSANATEDELELEGESPSSESDETWSNKPVSQQLSNGNNRQSVSPPSWLGRISSIASIRGLGDGLFVKKKSETSSNNCSQPSQKTGTTPIKRSRGRPANVKLEKESTTTAVDKDGNIIVTPIPEHVKNAIQLMLSVRHGFKGLQWELVESEFYHVYPNFESFKPVNHGYRNFEEMLRSPEMKTSCYAATPRGTVKGHDLHSRQGRLKYDQETGVFTILMKGNGAQEQEEDSKTNVESKIFFQTGQQIKPPKTPAITNQKQNSGNNTVSQQVTETRPSSRNSLPQKKPSENVGRPKTKVCKPSETTNRLLDKPSENKIANTLLDKPTMQLKPNPKSIHAVKTLAITAYANNDRSTAVNKDEAVTISTPESISNTSEATIVPTPSLAPIETQTSAQQKAVEDLLKIPALQNMVDKLVSQICQTSNNTSQPATTSSSSTTTNPERQFDPSDGFAQFYRRQELPDDWTRVKTYENSTETNPSESYRRNYYHERNFNSYDPRASSSRIDSSRRGRPGPERRSRFNSHYPVYSPIIPTPSQRGRGYGRYIRRKHFLSGNNQDERHWSPHSHDPSAEEKFRPENPRVQNIAYSVAVVQQSRRMADRTIGEIASSLLGIKYDRSTPSTSNPSSEPNLTTQSNNLI